MPGQPHPRTCDPGRPSVESRSGSSPRASPAGRPGSRPRPDHPATHRTGRQRIDRSTARQPGRRGRGYRRFPWTCPGPQSSRTAAGRGLRLWTVIAPHSPGRSSVRRPYSLSHSVFPVDVQTIAPTPRARSAATARRFPSRQYGPAVNRPAERQPLRPANASPQNPVAQPVEDFDVRQILQQLLQQ